MVSEVTEKETTAKLAAPMLILDMESGDYSQQQWKMWRAKWTAYARRIKLEDEEGDVQIATLIEALQDCSIEELETLPYESEFDKTDLQKVLSLLEGEYLED